MTDNPRKEMLEQIDIVNWLKAKDIFFFSVPNEGRRHFGELANMKKMGLHKGASDMIIMLDDELLILEKVKQNLNEITIVEACRVLNIDYRQAINEYMGEDLYV